MEDTEWNDLLRAYGIVSARIQEKEADSSKEIQEPYVEELKSSEHSELDDLDDPVVKAYSERRLQELQAYAACAKYGEIRMIEYKEWITEVTEASYNTCVLVFLYKDTISASQRLAEKLKQIAMKYPYIKMVKIQGNKAIQGYPDKNLPTLLIYKLGNLIGQKIVNLGNIEEVENWLKELNVLNEEEIDE
ncbi:hypothetical protein PNEG_00840 [Pneumocystis murina B123]|uniref:Phosducin domain-containing protein n=1 Tax=Pneumocystis murina (strain B123) TaxID=1069680 RepID=M7PJQ5_PNEMU|nr:hypothetical protein PNEG_00840 [Pneumocystis murina B123]EMR10689.1 hypothetical protein PNEG_00840 [Pneumocystis murina B123]